MRTLRSRLFWSTAALVTVACATQAPLEGSDKSRESNALGSVADKCTGLSCRIPTCFSETTTTISGKVTSPNGTLPIPNATVYIPNSAVSPPTAGVACGACGAPLSGDPITVATTDINGAFTLKGTPAGKNIPIVVQLGKWQRVSTIASVVGCTDNLANQALTRLPKTQAEGSMPHIALTTGGCDLMGCVLPKIGIADTEFGYESDGTAKAVNTYSGEAGGNLTGATMADRLWKNSTLLSTYDMAIFSCECSESLSSKGGKDTAPEFGVVTDYMNAGGRILTSDFQYTWYKYSPDAKLGGSPVGSNTIGIGEITGGAPTGGSPITLNTAHPDAANLANWLSALYPSSTPGQVTPDYVFSNIQFLNNSAETWAHSAKPNGPRVFTVNTPVGAAKQCGQGTHVDLHVDTVTGDTISCDKESDGGERCYPKTCGTSLTEDEAMIAYFIFNMSNCIE